MQTVKVFELMGARSAFTLHVDPETSLEVAIKEFAANDSLRAIFLIDGDERFRGIVSRRDLLNWSRLRLDIPLSVRPTSLATVRRLVLASSVREVIIPDSENIHLHPDDSLDKALDLMAEVDLLDLPVVDEDGRVQGTIRLSDILSFALTGPASRS